VKQGDETASCQIFYPHLGQFWLVKVAQMQKRVATKVPKMPVSADQQNALADPMSDGMSSPTHAAGGAKTAIDPVCGMTVTVTADTRTESFDGKPFHFCSDKCQTKFKGDPWFYASGNAAKRGKVASAGVQYTCPMHPQILRDAPGSCPICGMALEAHGAI